MTGNPEWVIVGAGGHARVVLQTLADRHEPIGGIIAPETTGTAVHGYPCLGDDAWLLAQPRDRYWLALGLGGRVSMAARQRVCQMYLEHGFVLPAVLHPTAYISATSRVDRAAQVMALAAVQPGTHIGEGSLINTGAVVDHDCSVGMYVHIAPGATVCGGCTLGDAAFIGPGATVTAGRHIGPGARVGAGAVVLHDVPAGATVVGSPAYSKESKSHA